ncbi:MAG: response regulator transcription factor [Bacteroidota bacterium]|jgi:two-component system alkaline phosphatase synthesis response regulator PhoP
MLKGLPKILVVDDELDILELIRHTLAKEGFEVHVAANGAQALDQTSKVNPEIILMDVMMPVMDGMEACRQLKENPDTKNIPVVFLTARSEEFAELAGFEAGADDYIAKPIRPRVLLSRIKAILRRRNALHTPEPEAIDFGVLKIDRERFVVEFEGKALQFPRKEFELLSFLASRPGRVFSRDEILENVWGNEVLVVDRTIDVHVRKIREKLNERFIYTVKGVGYKFEIE